MNEFFESDIVLTLHWISSVILILLSDCEWAFWAWYCSHVALNEFFESDIALTLHCISSLFLILLSDCKWVLWSWYCSHVALNEFSEPDIVLTLHWMSSFESDIALTLHRMSSLSLILLSRCAERALWVWYCYHFALNESSYFDTALRLLMSFLSLILPSCCTEWVLLSLILPLHCTEWVLWAWYCSHVALNEFSEPDIALMLHWMSSLSLILLWACTEWVHSALRFYLAECPSERLHSFFAVKGVSVFLCSCCHNFDFDMCSASKMSEMYALSYFTSTSEIHTRDFKKDAGKRNAMP